ncbi:MAG: cation diffusion facilitator family transporter [Kiritimatiellia bacterium]|nr:cation diffusion facilitator family transporter [Kiritimatiellia bacterium]
MDQERKRTERTALTGVVTCGLGLVLNIISVVLANSLVLVADFFNSLLELSSVSLSWFTLRRLRHDNRALFNYGLGKIENLASLMIGLFMLVSVLIMTFLIINRLIHPVKLKGFGIWLGIGCTFVFGIINARLWWRSWHHQRLAPSPIVDAQKRLFAVKTLSNTCMFFNFVVSVSVSWPWVMYLDPLTSCITLTFMINSGWHLLRHSVHDLLDRSLEEPLQMLITRQLVNHFDSYASLDGVRSRYSGRQIFIEIFLGFDAQKPLGETQRVMDAIKQNLEKEIPHAEVIVVPRAI